MGKSIACCSAQEAHSQGYRGPRSPNVPQNVQMGEQDRQDTDPLGLVNSGVSPEMDDGLHVAQHAAGNANVLVQQKSSTTIIRAK